MLTKEEIFNIATQPYGGRLNNHRGLYDGHKKRAEIFLSSYDKKKPFPSVIVDFVNSEVFNAFAMKYQ